MSARTLLPAVASLAVLGVAGDALACPDCVPGREARAALWNDPHLWDYVALLLLPFAAVAIGQALVSRKRPDGKIVAAGTLLGVGLGGFLDGIVLHQILQWHNMLSSWIPPTTLVTMKLNMLWDGLFHAFTWLVTVAGIAVLWRAGRQPTPWVTRTFVGAMIGGWGLFNVLEGVVDHQLLGIHHVHPGTNELAWDLGFIGASAAMIVVSQLLIRSGRSQIDRPSAQTNRDANFASDSA
jgi:uncharacterized membrane protein